MPTTEVWFASPDPQDGRDILRFSRIAIGPAETLNLLRDAENMLSQRVTQPDVTTQILVVVDSPAKLFADETHGLLLRARATSLSRRASRKSGVRLDLRW